MKAGPPLRAAVRFERLNLNADSFGLAERFDLVLCRNVLIYFEAQAKQRVVEPPAGAPRPGGLPVPRTRGDPDRPPHPNPVRGADDLPPRPGHDGLSARLAARVRSRAVRTPRPPARAGSTRASSGCRASARPAASSSTAVGTFPCGPRKSAFTRPTAWTSPFTSKRCSNHHHFSSQATRRVDELEALERIERAPEAQRLRADGREPAPLECRLQEAAAQAVVPAAQVHRQQVAAVVHVQVHVEVVRPHPQRHAALVERGPAGAGRGQWRGCTRGAGARLILLRSGPPRHRSGLASPRAGLGLQGLRPLEQHAQLRGA